MTDFDRSPDGLAFSDAVQAAQQRLGSRDRYRQAQWPIDISPDLAAFLGAQRSVFLATARADGQSYVQHRGGPPGFLKVLDSRTIGMADLEGNRQYISLGNLSENDRVELFLIDYMNRQRVKIWGRARFVEDDPDLVERLMPAGLRGRAKRALLISVEAWDVNCPQHIHPRFSERQIAPAIERMQARIAELETELERLQSCAHVNN